MEGAGGVFFIIVMIGFCFFAYSLFNTVTVSDVRREAIEHGYAHYSTDTRGNTTFEWNDKVKLP